MRVTPDRLAGVLALYDEGGARLVAEREYISLGYAWHLVRFAREAAGRPRRGAGRPSTP